MPCFGPLPVTTVPTMITSAESRRWAGGRIGNFLVARGRGGGVDSLLSYKEVHAAIKIIESMKWEATEKGLRCVNTVIPPSGI